MAAHGELGEVLREQRLGLVQRELLLDTMVQNTPVAMLLIAAGGDGAPRIVFANLTARKLLNSGWKLEGRHFEDLLTAAPAQMREALERGGDGLFTVEPATQDGGEEQVYHLSRRRFALNGREHELLLLRLLTSELRRQEVQTWKKVIRVISHELNNSLAPMASLAHSGAELVQRGQTARLAEVFATIEERARHLEGFIGGYARFAKLPQPQLKQVDWREFLEGLQRQIAFQLEMPEDPPAGRVRSRADGAGAAQPAEERARVRITARRRRRAPDAPAVLAAHRGTRQRARHERSGAGKARWCRSTPPSATAPASGWRWRARSSRPTVDACRCTIAKAGGLPLPCSSHWPSEQDRPDHLI